MTKMEIIEGLCTNVNEVEQQGIFYGNGPGLEETFGEGTRVAVGVYDHKADYYYCYNVQFYGKNGVARADALLDDASDVKNIIFLYKIED